MPDKKPKKDVIPDIEKAVRYLEDGLFQIETDEILKGYSTEVLSQKGFVGDKDITIERARHKETTEKEHLMLEAGVEYCRLPNQARFDDLNVKDFVGLGNVEKGQLIATRNTSETTKFAEGKNVRQEIMNKLESYYALCRGKVIIIRDALHVLPSDIDCFLSFRISKDKMQAFMNCTEGHGDGHRLSVDFVLERMRSKGIRHGALVENIEQAVEAARNTLEPQQDVLVAQGTVPIKGKDGYPDFQFKLAGETVDFKILPDGRIDYKASAIIETAKKGQLLGTLVDPKSGINGINVEHGSVPAESGKPARVIPGKGVKVSEDGKSFFADIDGCIVYNEPVLEMMDVYVVNGDVDYSTGSIEFEGNVLVHGSVLEGFEVKASGDIIVDKSVECATLLAGRDIRIAGGVQGYGKGVLSAGRDITVEFIQNARLEAQGNIYIFDFSVNSQIYCSKRVILQDQHGSIVGGETHAQLGIDVKNLGSEGGIKTLVVAGTDFLVRRKIQELDKALEFCSSNISKIDTALRPILQAIKSNPESVKHKNEVVQKTLKKRDELQNSRKVMEAKRELLYEKLNCDSPCFIKVSQICYADAYISIRGIKMHLDKQREHVCFYDDQKENEIKVGPY